MKKWHDMVGTFDFFSNFRKINEYIRLIGWELKVIESQQVALLPDLIPFWQFLLVAINRCPAHFIAFVQHNGGENPLKTSLENEINTKLCISDHFPRNIAIESLYFYERAVNKGDRCPYIDILQSRATYSLFIFTSLLLCNSKHMFFQKDQA